MADSSAPLDATPPTESPTPQAPAVSPSPNTAAPAVPPPPATDPTMSTPALKKSQDPDEVLASLAGKQADVDKAAADGGPTTYGLREAQAAAPGLGVQPHFLAGLFHHLELVHQRVRLTEDELKQAIAAFGARKVA